MEDTAVDIVLEKLMDLVNTNDKLILQGLTYVERRMKKNHQQQQQIRCLSNKRRGIKKKKKKQQQIEWIYKEMQFLRKFLKDSEDIRNEHEEVKDLVAKIGDVTCKVEDMVDLFYLVCESPETTPEIELSFNAADRSQAEESTSLPRFSFSLNLGNVIKETSLTWPRPRPRPRKSAKSSLLRCRLRFQVKSVTEEMVDLAKKIHAAFTPLVDHIYSMKSCKEEVMQILSEVGFPTTCHNNADELFQSLGDIYDEFCCLHSFSGKVLHVLMMGMSLTWPNLCVPGDYLLLSNMFTYMVNLAERICHDYGNALKQIQSFKRILMPHYSRNPALFSFLEHLSTKIRPIMTRPIMTGIRMNSLEEGFNLSHLKCLVIDNICHGFGSVVEEIESIKTEVMEIYDKKTFGFGVPHIGNSSQGAAVRATKPMVEEKIMVGFDDEKTTIIELLIREHEKQLKVVPIVGMPGLGKTTLAGIVYNDPFIVDHFPTRAWTYVSQVYRKRDLLLGTLSSGFNLKSEVSELSDEKLGEELYKHLKGKRYLIVLDDIWNIRTWDDLKIYFPDDNNRSRIMFTSRLLDVPGALHAMPHCLRFLNENESWDLLRQRVFQRGSCPPELMVVGKQIAKKCQGLPLAIVVIAGLLAKNVMTLEWWSHVATSVSSYIASDPEQYMDTLALSYNHLPHHLKSCFLYFSAFPEDYEISIERLVWLWIAEGFIHQIGEKSLEDVAEDYLMDLVDRSLVLVVRRRFADGIKSCCVHDLLRDLCFRKAKEENFLQQIGWHKEVSSSSCTAAKRRLCIHSSNINYISSELCAPHIRSFLYFGYEDGPIAPKAMSFLERGFKLLRVLDLSTINVSTCSYLIVQLVFLRYLALQGEVLELLYNISKLHNLETLIVSKKSSTYLPTAIWNMVKLRHLCIGGENRIGILEEDGNSFVLNNLKTILQLCPSSECQKLFARTPNLQKLVFYGSFESEYEGFWFPDLDFLNHLKVLKLLNRCDPDHHRYHLQGVKFPPNLKELTLSKTALAWEEMSIIGSLPNLESLKLEFQACVGPQWEASDGGFCRLKSLRLNHINIEKWNASSNHFPVLEHLVLQSCLELKEIPIEFGDIDTRKMIVVRWCSNSATNSARQIQEEQQGMGNNLLKFLIIPRIIWRSQWHDISVQGIRVHGEVGVKPN